MNTKISDNPKNIIKFLDYLANKSSKEDGNIEFCKFFINVKDDSNLTANKASITFNFSALLNNDFYEFVSMFRFQSSIEKLSEVIFKLIDVQKINITYVNNDLLFMLSFKYNKEDNMYGLVLNIHNNYIDCFSNIFDNQELNEAVYNFNKKFNITLIGLKRIISRIKSNQNAKKCKLIFKKNNSKSWEYCDFIRMLEPIQEQKRIIFKILNSSNYHKLLDFLSTHNDDINSDTCYLEFSYYNDDIYNLAYS